MFNQMKVVYGEMLTKHYKVNNHYTKVNNHLINNLKRGKTKFSLFLKLTMVGGGNTPSVPRDMTATILWSLSTTTCSVSTTRLG
jgi:hypothetical protein